MKMFYSDENAAYVQGDKTLTGYNISYFAEMFAAEVKDQSKNFRHNKVSLLYFLSIYALSQMRSQICDLIRRCVTHPDS